ncbi:hypothetical protein B0H13DRAFT_1659102, partial [Mycena leptocephala]
HEVILRGGGGSWIMRAFIGMGLVKKALKGPSIQVSVHHARANDSGDEGGLDLFWDDVSEGDREAVFGYIQGKTPEQDTWLFPPDAMFEEFSDHYYREWNPFCDKTFRHLKSELDAGRGKCRTRSDWKRYFQSSNRGTQKPKVVVNREFIEEGVAHVQGTFYYRSWNKRRLVDLARELPPQFRTDF